MTGDVSPLRAALDLARQARGSMQTADGRLVATITQEALLRPAR